MGTYPVAEKKWFLLPITMGNIQNIGHAYLQYRRQNPWDLNSVISWLYCQYSILFKYSWKNYEDMIASNSAGKCE